MARNTGWIRFYTRMIDSPEILELNDLEFRAIVSIWCLAGESEQPGVIQYKPIVLHRRLMLNCTFEAFQDVLAHLCELDLLAEANGGFVVPRWQSHQYEYPSQSPQAKAAQKQKERERVSLESRKGVARESLECRKGVATQDIDIDIDIDTDREREECVGDANASDGEPASEPTHTLLPSEVITPSQERRNAVGRALTQGGSMQGEPFFTELVSLGYSAERICQAIEVLRKARSPDEIAQFSKRALVGWLKSVMDNNAGKDWIPPPKAGKTMQDDRDAVKALLQEAYR